MTAVAFLTFLVLALALGCGLGLGLEGHGLGLWGLCPVNITVFKGCGF